VSAEPALGPRPKRSALLHEDEWYVSASSISAHVRKLVLKDNDAFLVADRRGDFPSTMPGEFGYYRGSTRFLSQMEVRLHGDLPLVLEATTTDEDARLVVELTNGETWDLGARKLPANTIHFRREILLDGDVLYQRLRLHNFDLEPMDLELALHFDSDFADMFEVRGTRRRERGKMQPARHSPRELVLSYLGLDGRQRRTRIHVEPDATECSEHRFLFPLRLLPGEDREVVVRVEPFEDEGEPSAPAEPTDRTSFVVPSQRARSARDRIEHLPSLETNHDGLNRILDRAVRDLVTMLSDTPYGLYPYAGIPWFCAPFGRDGAITALQLLPWIPEVSRGVLTFQARHQATDFDDFTDREPGKIFHELRTGEMAALHEIPFVPYYGTADATPLFLILLAQHVAVTHDLALLDSIWPNALAAFEWIERHGDLDGDGFVEYRSRSSLGLRNQGWKDSFDGISHEDGTLAEPPIAVCEVQAYVVRAYHECAALAELRGETELARTWRARSDVLRRRLHERFWLEDRGYFALALDAEKRPCRVLTTNAGHVLWAGAADEVIGKRMASILTGPELSSGFGLRTLGTTARRFSPLGYHNGSVWPHDNAIVAEGLRRYGNHAGFFEVLTSVLNALETTTDGRVPELFCGFERKPGAPPIPYPTACAPQSWASGAMLHFVRTMLGLSVDGATATVVFDDPVLPSWLRWIEVRNLAVPGGSMDFTAVRGRMSCSIEVLSKPESVRVLVRQ
jgi:glycogen debranching enzyme